MHQTKSIQRDQPINAPSINNQHSAIYTFTKVFWAAMSPLDPFIGIFVTQPLSDFFALKTYTHGTNFTYYLNIRCFDADPSKGASDKGSTASFIAMDSLISLDAAQKERERCKEYFYLFKDISDISEKDIIYQMNHKIIEFKHGYMKLSDRGDIYIGKNGKIIIDKLIQEVPEYQCRIASSGKEFIKLPSDDNWIIGEHPVSSDRYYLRSLLPIRHAIFSSLAAQDEKGVFATTKRIIGALSGLLTPTISIRINESDPIIMNLEIDPDFPSLAYRTKQLIPPSYIGLAGILHQGITRNMGQRIKNSPIKSFVGAMRLVALVAMIWIIYNNK